MRETLLVHVQNFTDAQRAHVPTKTTEVLYNQYVIPDIKAVGPAPEDPMAPPPGDEPGEAGALPARGIKEEMPDSMRPLD